MFNKVKNNALFSVLAPLLSLVGFAVMLPFNYIAYTQWIMWEMVLLDILSALCIFLLCFWSATNLVEKSKRQFAVFLGMASALCILYFLGGGLAIYFSENYKSILFGQISASFFFVAILFFTLSKLSEKKLIACVASFVILVLVGCSVLVGYLYKDTSNASLSVVQDFELQDTLPDGKGEKVKVILLNGQSNAAGVASVACLKAKTSAEEYARYEKGYENVYINYFVDNGSNTSYGSFVHAGLNMGYTDGYFGPELGLADALSQAYPDEKIFILKYAWGGSCLATQWFAPNEQGEEGALYTAFINFTAGCMEYLRSKNYQAEITAMCWMQGESDSSDQLAPLYYENQKAMVGALRNRLATYATDGNICFVDAGISDSVYWRNYQTVNQAKEKFATENPALNKYFSTADLSYSQEPTPEKPDLAHYDSLSEIELGRRFAREINLYLQTK